MTSSSANAAAPCSGPSSPCTPSRIGGAEPLRKAMSPSRYADSKTSGRCRAQRACKSTEGDHVRVVQVHQPADAGAERSRDRVECGARDRIRRRHRCGTGPTGGWHSRPDRRAGVAEVAGQCEAVNRETPTTPGPARADDNAGSPNGTCPYSPAAPCAPVTGSPLTTSVPPRPTATSRCRAVPAPFARRRSWPRPGPPGSRRYRGAGERLAGVGQVGERVDRSPSLQAELVNCTSRASLKVPATDTGIRRARGPGWPRTQPADRGGHRLQGDLRIRARRGRPSCQPPVARPRCRSAASRQSPVRNSPAMTSGPSGEARASSSGVRDPARALAFHRAIGRLRSRAIRSVAPPLPMPRRCGGPRPGDARLGTHEFDELGRARPPRLGRTRPCRGSASASRHRFHLNILGV